MAFGNLVLEDLDGLLSQVAIALGDSAAGSEIANSIEELQADYAQWFRDDAMRINASSGAEKTV